jgi:hypothetical protein
MCCGNTTTLPGKPHSRVPKELLAEARVVGITMAATEEASPAVSHRNSSLCALRQSHCFRRQSRRELCRQNTERSVSSGRPSSACHRRRFQTLSPGARSTHARATRTFHPPLPILSSAGSARRTPDGDSSHVSLGGRNLHRQAGHDPVDPSEKKRSSIPCSRLRNHRRRSNTSQLFAPGCRIRTASGARAPAGCQLLVKGSSALRPDEDCCLDRGLQLDQLFGDLLPRRVLRPTECGEATGTAVRYREIADWCSHRHVACDVVRD